MDVPGSAPGRIWTMVPHSPDPDPAAAADRKVDAILDELLALDASRCEGRLQDLCTDHPEHAAAVEARYRALQAVGLIDPANAFDHDGTPQIPGMSLHERLGEGGMGIVYRARQEQLGRDVAVKMIRPEFAWQDQQRRRFAREGLVVAQLEHPAIVPVLQLGEHHGRPFLVMPLVRGRSLAAIIATIAARRSESPAAAIHAHGFLQALDAGPDKIDLVAATTAIRGLSTPWPAIAACVLLPVAEALGYAHARGVTHRDIKPSNILLAADGRSLLCDFGLASYAETDDSLTKSGTLLGSVPYMSPEQVEGRTVDARSDVFSIGSVLYELLTMRRPFGSSSTSHTMHAIAKIEPTGLSGGAAETRLPADMAAIVARCLEKRPEHRYANGAAVAADLRAFLAGEPVAARRLTWPRRIWRYARREPVRFGLAAATLALAVSLTTALGYMWAQRDVVAAGQERLRQAQVERHLARGYAALFRRDAAAAHIAFASAQQIDPGSTEADVGLQILAEKSAPAAVDNQQPEPSGSAFHRAARAVFAGAHGDRAGAADAVLLLHDEVVLQTASARPIYHGLLAKAAGVAGDTALAENTARALRRLWPESATASYWAGYALMEIAPDDARRALERTCDLAPEDVDLLADAQLGLGVIELQRGNSDRAIRHFERVLAVRADDAFAWLDLGLAHQAKGDATAAEAALRRACVLPNAPAGARYNLGVLLAARDTEAAIEAFAATVAQAPDYALAWYNLGALRTANGELESGKHALHQAVRLRPQWADAWRHLGTNEATAGNLDRAVAAYRRVTQLAPDDTSAQSYLAQLEQYLQAIK
ncbi:MAG: protein kinase [Planctomycetota bacterium]